MPVYRSPSPGREGTPSMNLSQALLHPHVSRRTAIQAGALGLLGLGMNHRELLRAASPLTLPSPPRGEGRVRGAASGGKAKSCIYIFLSGGLAQHESFDMKPDAPAEIRGEFKPIATRTPGVQISE